MNRVTFGGTMKNIKDMLKKKHSKKEHVPHVNDKKRLDPASVKQEGLDRDKGGSFVGRRWYPEAPHKGNR